MQERHFRKLQKERHVAEIAFNLLSNQVFRNLTPRERQKMAKLIYKAELIDAEMRSKDSYNVMLQFNSIMQNLDMKLENMDIVDDDEDFDDRRP
jgi:hypothetical protein